MRGSRPRPDDATRILPSHETAVGAALLRATDVTTDAWAILTAIRDDADALVDLRIIYGNAPFWNLSGMDPDIAIGRGIGEVNPAIDWTQGLAEIMFRAVVTGRDHFDRHVRVRPQVGPFKDQDRVFEVELTVADDIVAAGYRDITDAVQAEEDQAADARRTAALARFLSMAVDPSIGRAELLARVADEIAATIGDLCAIIQPGPDGTMQVVAVAGGPGPTAARIRATHQGRPMEVPPGMAPPSIDGETLFLAEIPDELRPATVGSMRTLGLPDELASTITSMIATSVRGRSSVFGRIHVERFGDAAPYTADDVVTLEAIASAAALVCERREVQAHLETSLHRFEALFVQAPVPMIFGTDAGIRFNAAAADLFGRDVDELARLAGQPDSPWIPDDDVERWADLRRSFATRERREHASFSLMRPSGERREVLGAAIPLTGPDGTPVGVVIVLDDMTVKLSLEAQLRHAQKMEALGRFAGGIAHDFNNVLMAILGFAEFLAADAREGRATPDDADQVVAATRKAIDLTARLTTFARRETARRVLTDIPGLIEGILPLVRRLAPESIEIATDLEHGPFVLIDPTEFEQVVVNLVVNSTDAMPRGGRLTIETHPVDLDPASMPDHLGRGSGRHVLVAISDTGMGMDEVTRNRIFEPFYTTKDVGAGTGLGLSMVYAAVERAGGTIWVYSEPGHGTTFKIYLPAATTPGTGQTDGDLAVGPAPGGNETVLLVEDDALVRELVVRVLEGYGYTVIQASLPSEALVLAETHAFDILVSDVVMPEMTGDAMAGLLRTTSPDLPVVYMSGYTARALEFELGPLDTLVHKPISTDVLARTVRAALDR